MSEHLPDLSFRFIEDEVGTLIRLEQRDYCGESVLIDLHPTQLRLLAERAGIIGEQTKQPIGANDGVAARRLKSIAEKLLYLASADYYRIEICERAGIGLQFFTEFDTITDLAMEYRRDLEGSTSMSQDVVLRNRLQRLSSQANELHEFLAGVLSFPPHDAEDEDVALARRLAEAIEDMLADHFGTEAIPKAAPLQQAVPKTGQLHEHGRDDKSPDAISVTPIPVTEESPKRGRPPTGEAKTNAERQREYRERKTQQSDLALEASA